MPDTPTLHSVRVPRTARYATLGQPSKAAEWWVVLHGYGQLAADFIQAFTGVATLDRCVVAPEGLSRFYVDAMSDHEQVGASWMTREAREAEITDYVEALDAMMQHLAGKSGPPPVRVLGFSQGAATASRWAVRGQTAIDRLVLWGSGPAHDLNLDQHAPTLQSMALTLVAGTKDPHLSSSRRKQVREHLREHKIPVTVHTFDGGHELNPPTLRTIVEE